MPTDPAPSSTASATTIADPARRGARPSWLSALRIAIPLYIGLLLVVYLVGAILTLAQAQPSGVAISGAAGWPDALSYPLSFADAQTPIWLQASLGLGLVVAFVACVAMARLLDSAPAAGIAPTAKIVLAMAPAAGASTAPASAPTTLPTPARAASAAATAGAVSGEVAAVAAPPLPATETLPAEPARESAAPRPAPDSPRPTLDGRVFVSHSSADNAFGHTLVARLRAAGLDAWYDSSGGLVGGDIWWDRIVAELSERGVFVVLLSPEAMRSAWVRDEIRLAWQQKNGATGKVIVPVLQRPCDAPPYVGMVQMVRFDKLPDEDAFADLLVAIRAGQTRMLEPQLSLRLGAPFDEALLPPPPRFIGREADLAWVEERLRSGGTTGITTAVRGVGGIGKTALAAVAVRELRWANRFRDGVAVVICAGMRDPREVLRLVLLRFDAQRQIPDDVDLATLGNLARELLSGKDALIVLDNVEPELAIASVVAPLREAGATLLLTARHALPRDAVPAGGSRMLELLSPEDALDLFAEYYRHGAALDLTQNERASAERIVEALGRHTLAVKLAAATAADTERDLNDFARDLGDPRHALDLTENEAPQAVRETFNSSYRSLPEEAQRLFAALAAFATVDVGRGAVAVVAEALGVAPAGTTIDLLVRRALADGAVNEAMPEGSDRQRLRLHPLLRAFAQERFATWPDEWQAEAQRAAAVYYADYAETAATPDAARAVDEANIEGAIDWAHAQVADALVTRLCMGMRHFWRDRGRTREALRFLPWGMEAAERVAAESGDPQDRSRAASLELYYAKVLYQYAGGLEEAHRLLVHNRESWRALRRRRDEATPLDDLGLVARQRGQLAEAQRYYEESLAISREVGDRPGEGAILNNLGLVARQRGQLAEAQRYYEESLKIAHEVGDRPGEGTTLNNLGEAARQRGQLGAAQRYYEESLKIAHEVGDRRGEGTALNNLGLVAQVRGQLAEAQRYFEESLAIRREVGDRSGEGVTLNNLGGVAQDRGQLAEAQRYYEESLAIARETQYAELEQAAGENLEAVVAERGRAEGSEA